MHTVTIIYKSGAKVEIQCESFGVKHRGSGIAMEWKNATPNPLLIGVDEIAAVWEGKIK